MTSVPKSGWAEDKYIEEAMELFKLEGKGERLGKEFIFEGCWHFLKGSPEVEGWLRLCSGSFKIEAR